MKFEWDADKSDTCFETFAKLYKTSNYVIPAAHILRRRRCHAVTEVDIVGTAPRAVRSGAFGDDLKVTRRALR